MLRRKLTFSRWRPVEGRPVFEPHAAAAAVESLTEAAPRQAILTEGDLSAVVLVHDRGAPDRPTKLQLLALRDPDNRPLEFGPGEPLGPIQMLAHHYPADVTHVEIWPDGLAGQDRHGNAPRLTRLARYLRRQVGHYVSFEQLYQPDLGDRLADIRGQLRSVDIALTTPERLDQDPGVFGTLIPSIWGEQMPSLSVHLGMGRYTPRDRYIDSGTEERVFEIAERAHDVADTMILTGRSRRTNRSTTVDLLNETLHVPIELPRSPDGGSMPDSDRTFSELERVHSRMNRDGVFEAAIEAQAMRPR